jgi:CubicO group peptidase (beta-lactamase class C family)
MLLPLLGALAGAAIATPAAPSDHWSCYTASDAGGRKTQFERSLSPHVVFDGGFERATVESRLAVYRTPALSVAVLHDGKLDWSAAWGRLQKDGARADCASLFQAGSIAKPVTVLAALRMKTSRLIDFDRSIESYLSSYHLPTGRQSDAAPVTFRNLFTHTSGITPGGYAGYAQNEAMPTDQQILRGEVPSNSKRVEVLAVPGASLSYSGGGYTIAEVALQDHLRAPFDQLMREWLLGPVGMKQADFTVPLPPSSHSLVARGHLADGAMVPGGWNNYPEQAAAGLWATASDLARLLIEIRKGYMGKSFVFSPDEIRELLAHPIENHVYGFRLVGEGENVFITHYGGTTGYRAGVTLNLRTGDGAAFLMNSDNGANLGEEILNALSRIYEWPAFREERVARGKQSAAVLRSLTGNYLFADQGWKVSVAYERNSLTLIFPNGDRLAMVPIQGKPLEFVHDSGVHANFAGKGKDMTIHLYGQTGQRQAAGE